MRTYFVDFKTNYVEPIFFCVVVFFSAKWADMTGVLMFHTAYLSFLYIRVIMDYLFIKRFNQDLEREEDLLKENEQAFYLKAETYCIAQKEALERSGIWFLIAGIILFFGSTIVLSLASITIKAAILSALILSHFLFEKQRQYLSFIHIRKYVKN